MRCGVGTKDCGITRFHVLRSIRAKIRKFAKLTADMSRDLGQNDDTPLYRVQKWNAIMLPDCLSMWMVALEQTLGGLHVFKLFALSPIGLMKSQQWRPICGATQAIIWMYHYTVRTIETLYCCHGGGQLGWPHWNQQMVGTGVHVVHPALAELDHVAEMAAAIWNQSRQHLNMPICHAQTWHIIILSNLWSIQIVILKPNLCRLNVFRCLLKFMNLQRWRPIWDINWAKI